MKKWLSPIVPATAFALLPTTAYAADILYDYDFQADSLDGWHGSFASLETAPLPASDGSFQSFLGLFTRIDNAGATDGSPPYLPVYSTRDIDTAGHNLIDVSFDLYAVNGLNGSNFFSLLVNGSTIFSNSFSNIPEYTQDFGGHGSAAGTGADPALTNSLGYDPFDDHVYHFTFRIPTLTDVTNLRFAAQTDTFGNGAFGVDNVRVSAVTSAVPEPATWMILLLGFGIVGTGLRRRQRIELAQAG